MMIKCYLKLYNSSFIIISIFFWQISAFSSFIYFVFIQDNNTRTKFRKRPIFKIKQLTYINKRSSTSYFIPTTSFFREFQNNMWNMVYHLLGCKT